MLYLKRIIVSTAVIAVLAFVFGIANGQTPVSIINSAWAAPIPASSAAADNNRNEHVHRYYDPVRKDYHMWTEQEEHAYRDWMKDQHRNYRDFAKLHRKDQNEYWRWRHDHSEYRDVR